MDERNGADNFRDRNMFLNNKSGATPVLWAGEAGRYGVAENPVDGLRLDDGDPRVDE